MDIAVLDANSFWTDRLFAACTPFARVLLTKPREVRAYYQKHQTIWSDRSPTERDDEALVQRFSFPPGWLFYLWPLAQGKIVRALRSFFRDDAPSVLVLNYPPYFSILDDLSPDVVVYYNTDDYKDHWPDRSVDVQRLETEAVRRADASICIAKHRTEVLSNRVPDRADDIHHVPIGCTTEFMVDRPDWTRTSVPEALADFDRPLAGYIGTLNWRFNYPLLAEVARLRPDVNFILGGPEPSLDDDHPNATPVWKDGLRRARTADNVHFLGWIPHDRLGTYLRAFDVLLMPYADVNFNRNACPAKLWDYLGTALPIVANDVVPEVNQWNEILYLTSDASGFAEALDDALTEDPAARRPPRLEVARNHTWDRLAERVERIVEPLVERSSTAA